jgi:hypothetical protein
MALYPDFYAAKRQDVPDMARAAYLQANANSTRDEENRQRYNDRNEGLGTLYQGVADSMPEGKNPISEALRLGKAGFNKMRGVEQPMSSPGRTEMAGMQGPAPSSSPGRSAIADQLRSQPAPQPVRPSAPAPAPAPAPVQQGSSSPGRSPMAPGGGSAMPPKAPPMIQGGKGDGFSIPRGPGPQATNVPIDKMIDMQMAGKGTTSVPGMTASVGGKPPPPASGPGLNAGSGALSAAMGAANVMQQPTKGGKAKAGVGAVGSTGLATAGPALAAAGPVGWAGLAGLAAMSLYGMLG